MRVGRGEVSFAKGINGVVVVSGWLKMGQDGDKIGWDKIQERGARDLAFKLGGVEACLACLSQGPGHPTVRTGRGAMQSITVIEIEGAFHSSC